jgi:hypothetical protein
MCGRWTEPMIGSAAMGRASAMISIAYLRAVGDG